MFIFLHHVVERDDISYLAVDVGEPALSETFPTLWLIVVNVQLMEVIGLLFQYLKMLRSVGPQEWVFQEQKAISTLNFEYSEDPFQDEHAMSLASMSCISSVMPGLMTNKHAT